MGGGGPYQRRARVCGAPCQSAPGGPNHAAGRGGSGPCAGSLVAARGLSGVSAARAAAGRAQPSPVPGPAAPRRRRRPFLPPSRPPARGVGGAGPGRKNGAALNARGEEPGGLRVRRRPRADRDPPRGGPGRGGAAGRGAPRGAPGRWGRSGGGGGQGPRVARPLCAAGPRPAGAVRRSEGCGRRGASLPGPGFRRPVRLLPAVLLRFAVPGAGHGWGGRPVGRGAVRCCPPPSWGCQRLGGSRFICESA